MPALKFVLLICGPSLQGNWKEECDKWMQYPDSKWSIIKADLYTGKHSLLMTKLENAVKNGKQVILMISIQSLSKRFYFIKGHEIDMILIDEAHVGYARKDNNPHRALLM